MELDLIRHIDDNEKSATELSEQKKHEFHLIGHQRVHRGHILFSFNTVTKEIKKARLQYCRDVDFSTRRPLYNPKVVVERDCVYIQCLNKKNLIKRLVREGFIL